MTIDWLWEAQDQRPDPETGIELVHLTHSAASSWNSDGEEPRASPDGRRVVIRRAMDVNLSPQTDLLVSDLDTKRLAHIARLAGGLPTLLCLDIQERRVQTVHAQPDMINAHGTLSHPAARLRMLRVRRPCNHPTAPIFHGR